MESTGQVLTGLEFRRMTVYPSFLRAKTARGISRMPEVCLARTLARRQETHFSDFTAWVPE